MSKFTFPPDGDLVADIREKYGYDGDLLQIFAQNTGAAVDKWHHYLPIYERYFGPMRNKPLRFLEIGVAKGGSLQMWRKYFGPEIILYGIDTNKKCRQFDGQAGQVRIGSQADPEFLASVVAEMGGVDVVLDDGSHQMPHIETSLKVLFPLLSSGGTYLIEDLHTAYWPKWDGGYKAPENFFNSVRQIIDDMHRWYHGEGVRRPEMGGMVTGVHVHDSIVVIEKGPVPMPQKSLVG